jgi:hypothetical protein
MAKGFVTLVVSLLEQNASSGFSGPVRNKNSEVSEVYVPDR